MSSLYRKNLKSFPTLEVLSSLVLFFLCSWSLFLGVSYSFFPTLPRRVWPNPGLKWIGEQSLLSAYAEGYLLHLSHPLGALWVNRADEHEELHRAGKTFLHGIHHFHYCCTTLILGNCHRGYIHCLHNRIFFCFYFLVVLLFSLRQAGCLCSFWCKDRSVFTTRNSFRPILAQVDKTQNQKCDK